MAFIAAVAVSVKNSWLYSSYIFMQTLTSAYGRAFIYLFFYILKIVKNYLNSKVNLCGGTFLRGSKGVGKWLDITSEDSGKIIIWRLQETHIFPSYSSHFVGCLMRPWDCLFEEKLTGPLTMDFCFFPPHPQHWYFFLLCISQFFQ